MATPATGKILIRRIEQGQGSKGCHPKGVQIQFKESLDPKETRNCT